jgi:phosphoribosylcarboxyaminoimidazole (NCAIR) mutase
MVQSMTGNKDYKSALVYAHRNPLALKEFAKKDWEEKDDAE